MSAGAERAEHMFDSPLRFLDWLTMGVISANQNRGEVLLEEPNLYNAVNWLTMGAADTVSGAIAPEEPLSLQHWMDSYATVMAGYGAWKSGKAIAKGKSYKAAENKNVQIEADIRKFTEYIFKDGSAPGKDVVFKNLGYSIDDSDMLLKIYQEQASLKYSMGDFTYGKLDSYGQRINIEIELKGIGTAIGKTSYIKSGWMINSDGSIKLNTPFSGFTR